MYEYNPTSKRKSRSFVSYNTNRKIKGCIHLTYNRIESDNNRLRVNINVTFWFQCRQLDFPVRYFLIDSVSNRISSVSSTLKGRPGRQFGTNDSGIPTCVFLW